MPTQQQDIHDVFATLLNSSPSLSAHDNMRTIVLRFASILSDVLARLEILESQAEADLATAVEATERLPRSDQAPYQLQLDNLLTFARKSRRLIDDHDDWHANFDIRTLVASFDDLKGRVDVQIERIDQHAIDHKDLDALSIGARLAGLDDKCATLAPLLVMLPLPGAPVHTVAPEGEEPS